MGTMDCGPWQAVQECICGARAVDGEVAGAVGQLAARLDGLHELHPIFAGVEFSEHVEPLLHAGAVGVS